MNCSLRCFQEGSWKLWNTFPSSSLPRGIGELARPALLTILLSQFAKDACILKVIGRYDEPFCCDVTHNQLIITKNDVTPHEYFRGYHVVFKLFSAKAFIELKLLLEAMGVFRKLVTVAFI